MRRTTGGLVATRRAGSRDYSYAGRQREGSSFQVARAGRGSSLRERLALVPGRRRTLAWALALAGTLALASFALGRFTFNGALLALLGDDLDDLLLARRRDLGHQRVVVVHDRN